MSDFLKKKAQAERELKHLARRITIANECLAAQKRVLVKNSKVIALQDMTITENWQKVSNNNRS